MATIRKRTRAHGHAYEVDFTDAAGTRRRLAAPTREAAENLRAEQVREARQAIPSGVDREVTLKVFVEHWLAEQAACLEASTLRTTARFSKGTCCRPSGTGSSARSTER